MGNSISKLMESFDSIISKNRSSFSTEECCVLEKVKYELSRLTNSTSKMRLFQRRKIVCSIFSELLKLLIDPKLWTDIKNIL